MTSVFEKDDKSFEDKPEPTQIEGWSDERGANDFPLNTSKEAVLDPAVSACPVCSGKGYDLAKICGVFLRDSDSTCPQCKSKKPLLYTRQAEHLWVCAEIEKVTCKLCRGSGKVRPA